MKFNMRPQDVANTIKAGAFVSILLFLFIMSTMMISKENSLFERKMTLFTRVDNAKSLKPGSSVKLRGIKIGAVETITFEKMNSIVLELKVESKHRQWIKKDSFISVQTQGMLGDKFLEILGGSDEAEIVKHNDFLITERSKELKDFITKGDNILLTVNRVLGKVELILDDLNENHNLRRVVENFAKTSSKMDQMFTPKAVKGFAKTLANMGDITAEVSLMTKKINSGPGTVHSFVYDNSVYEDLQSLLGGAQRSNILKYFIRETIKETEKVNK